MNFGRGLASIALFGLGVCMLYFKINACGMGILMFLGLVVIWDRQNKEDGEDEEKECG